ncbi:MAG: hypothetical protein V4492_04495 [Chlamydiota bacterium]
MSTVHFPEKALGYFVSPDWDDIEEAILEVKALNQPRYSSEEQQLQLFNARGKVIAFVSRGIPDRHFDKGNLPAGFEDQIHLGLIARPVVHECHGVKHSFDFINLNKKKTLIWECPFTRNTLEYTELSPDHETQQSVYQIALAWLDAFKAENPDYKNTISLLQYPDPEFQPPETEQSPFHDSMSSPLPPRDLWIRDIVQSLSDTSPRRHTINW